MRYQPLRYKSHSIVVETGTTRRGWVASYSIDGGKPFSNPLAPLPSEDAAALAAKMEAESSIDRRA